MSVPGSAPSPIGELGQARGDGVDQRVGDVADRDGDGQRHAALAGGAVGRRDDRVRGHVDVGVGEHQGVVLRAAEGLDPLAVGPCRSRRCSWAIGVEPTKLTAAMPGWSRMASTASLSPCTTVKTPSGRPASLHSCGEEERGGRVLLAGLEDERVAAGDRVGAHPQRHHRREVEGRDAGDDAERLADVVDVDAGRGLLGEPALEQLRDADGELDVLQAAGDLARWRRESTLPCSAVMIAASSSVALVQQLAEGEEDGRSGATATPGASCAAASAALATAASTSAALARSTSPVCCAGGGVEHGRRAAGSAGASRAVDPVEMRVVMPATVRSQALATQ